MRQSMLVCILSAGFLVIAAGCETSKSPGQQATNGKPPAAVEARPAFTAENNPTTLGGRGEPGLDDQNRPAAWIYIDGRAGHFTEQDGNPLMQWVMDGPVSSNPTFRVEVYEPLLGSPADFNCILQTIKADDESRIVYGIEAPPGGFEAGKQYSLLSPGGGFVIRDGATRATLGAIDPLVPGTYLIAGHITNKETGAEALAVTYFTVGE